MLIGCLVASVPAAFGEVHESPSDTYYDIGGFHFKVSTESELAQTWFDRGLAMCFGFNHEEAVRCFERAFEEDPTLAMALWGMSYAWGANINNMEIVPHQIAQAALAARLAELQSAGATEAERDLIKALATRYVVPVPEDRTPLNKAYADAMRGVYARHGDDPTIAGLYAESLMNLQPWKNWTPEGEPGTYTHELISVLEKALEHDPGHPFLCHLYIHAMEASPTPEKALPYANRLRTAMPGSGHLVHMPSHIDVLVGDYAAAITANQKAIAADAEFLRREGGDNFYTLYRMHNFHFVVYGAMFAGQKETALQAARELVKQAPEDVIRKQADMLDGFIPTPLHVLVRFGMWEEVFNEPEPPEYLPMSRAMRHYARAIAYAATGRIDEAVAEQQRFDEALKKVPETSKLFQNTSRDILKVAESMVRGEIAYRKGEFDLAFDHLREAVRRDDALNYDEPWGWMQPARHALGALLLERGELIESETVYRADLKRHPNNVWALHGLIESLERQGKSQAAAEFKSQFDALAKQADVKIDRSCYCRVADQVGPASRAGQTGNDE
jgi:tetratricopeptide (TPR) repeat protein